MYFFVVMENGGTRQAVVLRNLQELKPFLNKEGFRPLYINRVTIDPSGRPYEKRLLWTWDKYGLTIVDVCGNVAETIWRE